ncbi:RibD family protein [Aspergillus clavatus NRRL 1]|uniref:2,5-diamino-6-ribosylamino-4(3H)-pyrimidinone 5'-phosphate reductase n=1 Tax=Aspergillus clavatus (strain ATCC 1007 / CBS 513.65 / DSM 816 / NCTC 3887 / NRRL 1 / QM 1276 / 107) TaxID=344612 RepID=A1C8Z1_ASPCL|nr:riboflavin-specific deaminase [Aspergillus clavatus NRRL 1]EAW13315.1 riboflavin-specific deaminase [Aspergillus clavatus NRRL 1]
MDQDGTETSDSSSKLAQSDRESGTLHDEASAHPADGLGHDSNKEFVSGGNARTTQFNLVSSSRLHLHDTRDPMEEFTSLTTLTGAANGVTSQTVIAGPTKDQNGTSVSGPDQGTTKSHSLIDNPPNLARIRQVMFECKEPIEISLDEFETYWPFIDNVWVKQRSNSSKEGHCTTDYYMCRLRRPTHRTSETRPLPEGKRPRKKRVREGGMCNFQIKVVRFEGAYSTVTIARTPGSSHIHSHNLDYIDKVKRNSGLMEFARKEAVKGYLPSSIYTKFQEEPEKLAEAGGKFCTVTDVRNVSAKWRIQNPEVKLVPHDGYTYQKGHGIVRTQDTSDSSNLAPASKQPNFTAASPLPSDTLSFPQFSLEFLDSYLPRHDEKRHLPHVTLSYASSMDSKISLLPGMQTVLSGPEAKLMTHYLRSRHDAILIGVGTALADNPGLNCRLEGAGGFGGLGRMWQPRPVVIDPTGRWPVHPECRMLRTAVEGKGKAPWVIVSPGAQIHPQKLMMLKGYGGDFLRIVEYNQNWRLRWEAILRALASEGIKSVMIEGGGTVLSELLNPEYAEFIDSMIVTVAPTYLGRGGVGVSPDSKRDEEGKPNAALNPRDVKWMPLGQNVIMCGKIRASTSVPPGG